MVAGSAVADTISKLRAEVARLWNENADLAVRLAAWEPFPKPVDIDAVARLEERHQADLKIISARNVELGQLRVHHDGQLRTLERIILKAMKGTDRDD